MANFLPLKHYILYCLGRAMTQFRLRDPFLDVGCGVGDISEYLQRRGWKGTAIDNSPSAVDAAARRFSADCGIRIERQSLFDHRGQYRTVIAMDVVEHIRDDRQALAKIVDLTEPGGHVALTVPSNPKEWRWDDDFYGHVRRYALQDLQEKLRSVGLEIVAAWDITWPLFWALRRAYTRFKRRPDDPESNAANRTAKSSIRNAWNIPGVSALLQHSWWLWRPFFGIQFALFHKAVNQGHEMMIIAKKSANPGSVNPQGFATDSPPLRS